MKYSLALIASFLAGYGAALLGRQVEEMSPREVERRTRPEPNVVRLTPREELSLRGFLGGVERITVQGHERLYDDPEYLNPDKAGA